MRINRFTSAAIAAVLVLSFSSCGNKNGASGGDEKSNAQELSNSEAGVEITHTGGKVSLSVDGENFRIRGAGGPGGLDKLAEFGGNAIRTWGFDQLENGLLDEAQRHGLKVAAGIWLRHDLDYNDENQVAEQTRLVLEGVRKYKDHPAVLLWGIGNEMEGDGSRTEVWEHVEALAKLIREEDPSHPTMTVLAEVGGDKIKNLHKHCPSIDIVGINSYGGAPTIPKRFREAGGTKPYVLTEFGSLGPWEFPKNAIGSVDEELGKAKAARYLEAYRAVDGDLELCLGSFAFMWGHKQEATPTWFGLFLADGRRTAAVDVLSKEWSGKPVADLCPQIDSLELIKDGPVKVGSTLRAKLVAHDPEGEPLKVEWVLMEDAKRHSTGGYHQDTPPTFKENLLETSLTEVAFRVPDMPGLYRIFAYVGDGKGGADVANVVFRVEP